MGSTLRNHCEMNFQKCETDYNQSEAGRGSFGCTNYTKSCGVKITPRTDEKNETIITDTTAHSNRMILMELYLPKKWKMLMKKSCIGGETCFYF